jgi:hypothetical protein
VSPGPRARDGRPIRATAALGDSEPARASTSSGPGRDARRRAQRPVVPGGPCEARAASRSEATSTAEPNLTLNAERRLYRDRTVTCENPALAARLLRRTTDHRAAVQRTQPSPAAAAGQRNTDHRPAHPASLSLRVGGQRYAGGRSKPPPALRRRRARAASSRNRPAQPGSGAGGGTLGGMRCRCVPGGVASGRGGGQGWRRCRPTGMGSRHGLTFSRQCDISSESRASRSPATHRWPMCQCQCGPGP